MISWVLSNVVFRIDWHSIDAPEIRWSPVRIDSLSHFLQGFFMFYTSLSSINSCKAGALDDWKNFLLDMKSCQEPQGPKSPATWRCFEGNKWNLDLGLIRDGISF